jgi:hypothetical protein
VSDLGVNVVAMADGPKLKAEHQIYADLMDEARIRIQALERAIDERDAWAPRMLQEFCYLQLRMLCETITLGCMVAHGDVTGKNILKKYEPNVMLGRLESLNPDFFPKGVRFRFQPGGVQMDDYLVPQLTKDELIKLWNISGAFLHRGSAKRVLDEPRTGPDVDLDAVIAWMKKIGALLDNHFISSADRKTHICAGLLNEQGTSFIFVAQSP